VKRKGKEVFWNWTPIQGGKKKRKDVGGNERSRSNDLTFRGLNEKETKSTERGWNASKKIENTLWPKIGGRQDGPLQGQKKRK